MNEIRRIESEADEIARVDAVMERFPLPDFAVGYTIDLGELGEEPAVWVRFETTHRFPKNREQRARTARQTPGTHPGDTPLAHNLRELYEARTLKSEPAFIEMLLNPLLRDRYRRG